MLLVNNIGRLPQTPCRELTGNKGKEDGPPEGKAIEFYINQPGTLRGGRLQHGSCRQASKALDEDSR